MSESQNPATVIVAVLFGALTGAVALILLAWQAGFLDINNEGSVQGGYDRATPGMDILENYVCLKGETKHIILGGVEDNFSTGNIEQVSASLAQKEFAKRHNTLGAVGVTRNYDERGLDNILFDEFLFPPNVEHGIVVTSLQELSTLKNDGFSLGSSPGKYSHVYGISVTGIQDSPLWTKSKTVLSADITHLNFMRSNNADGNPLPQIHKSLLEYVQAGEPVTLMVSDDTMVDFIGFAVCSSPNETKGMTFLINQIELPTGFLSLSCTDSNQTMQCNPYTGDTICETALPMACFNDKLESVPEFLSDNSIRRYWSGGEVKFTGPVAGEAFDNEDDVHNFCKAQFGTTWRALTSHDGGVASSVIARGEAPQAKRVWLDVKTQPYGNCWNLRPEFEDKDTGATANE